MICPEIALDFLLLQFYSESTLLFLAANITDRRYDMNFYHYHSPLTC